MKKVLIMVVSSENNPYGWMITKSMLTWDLFDVEGVETIFYCGASALHPSDAIIYFPFEETLHNMGYKDLAAFEWALQHKDFDYIARPNSSCYVNKKELIKYVQGLDDNNVFAGLVVEDTPKWVWGGGQYIISRDVVEKIVANKHLWDHTKMEDMAMSMVVTKAGIPFTNGRACSIDKTPQGWRCMCYGTPSFTFDDFSEITKAEGQFFFRVKQDYDRNMDAYVMDELYNFFKQ